MMFSSPMMLYHAVVTQALSRSGSRLFYLVWIAIFLVNGGLASRAPGNETNDPPQPLEKPSTQATVIANPWEQPLNAKRDRRGPQFADVEKELFNNTIRTIETEFQRGYEAPAVPQDAADTRNPIVITNHFLETASTTESTALRGQLANDPVELPVNRFDQPPDANVETNHESTQAPQLSSEEFQIAGDQAIQSLSRSEGQGELIWWPTLVVEPFDPTFSNESATTNELLYQALCASPRILAISQDPLISELQIIEADSEFDPAIFVRSLYEDRTDPVGNTLTTGSADEFLKDNIWTGRTGIRRKLRTGGNLELAQELGFKNSNSRFFVPQDQGTATLSINYTQPLLRGAGRYYNRSQIVIAESAANISWHAFATELQSELESVLDGYWTLYLNRSVLLQKQRNVARGEQILKTLQGRQELDSLPSQIARARSSVEARRTDLANALRDVRNTETRIRQSIGDPNWLAKEQVEILPVEHPQVHEFEVPLSQIVFTALDHRPEIREAIQRTKIAAVRYQISTNELLPELTLLFGTYASALNGDSGIEQALVRQYSDTTPGYSAGLELEIPYRNRSARSRWAQEKLQVKKIRHELDETAQGVIADAQLAHRRVRSALDTLKASYVAIEAASLDVGQQQQRWESFALVAGDVGDGNSPTTVLDQLLDSQDRLAAAELKYSQALYELQISIVALHRAAGTLLLHEGVAVHRAQTGWLPNIRLEQEPGG
jgi:outer membrane protein TolC